MKKSIIILALFFFSFFPAKYAQACHYLGARMTYTYLGGTTYKITLVLYSDCVAMVVPNTLYIKGECQTNSNYNFNNIALNLVSSESHEITPLCSGATTYCNGGSNFGIKEFIYEGNINALNAALCGSWRISLQSNLCRLPSDNIVSSTNSLYNSLYVETTFDNSNGVNNAPVYGSPMLWLAAKDESVSFAPDITDPDGDSLSYDFYNPMLGKDSAATFINGYDSVNFVSSSLPVSLNHVTGELKIKPDSLQMVNYGIKISKWRKINGVATLMGVVYNDLILKVYGSTNHNPVLSGMIFNGGHQYSPSDTVYSKEVDFPAFISFNIAGHDPDTFNASVGGRPDIFTISWDTGIAAATFTAHNNITDSAWAHFQWTPQLGDVAHNPHCFNVEIRDSACPYNAIQRFSYCLTVKLPKLYLGADTTICIGQSLVLQGDSGNYSYLWSTGDTTRQITVDGSVLSPGTYQYWLKQTGYGSTQYDTITVVVQICEGIGKLQNDDFIAIAPNPNNGIFEVLIRKNTGKDLQMEVFDSRNKKVLGKTFKTNVKNKSFRVDLSGCAKGLYFLRFYSADFSVVKKVVLR